MKIEHIENLNNNIRNNFTAKSKNISPQISENSSLKELNGINVAYYDINFGGSYETNNRRRFARAKANFTPEAYRIWREIEAVTKKFKNSQITHQHVFLAVMVDLNNFIESLNSGVKKYDEESQYTTSRSFASFIGDPDLLKNEETRKKTQAIIKKYIKETVQELQDSNLPKSKLFNPKPTDQLVADMNTVYSATTQILDTDDFIDNNFLGALFSSDDRKLLNKINALKFEIQQATMIDDLPQKQKNHLNFYDSKADQLWKSLDHGNDTYITYEGENKTSVKHLISSFVNLIKKPGQTYSKLNTQNTEIIIFNKRATFDFMRSMAEKAKKDPKKTYIFVADFSDLMEANTIAEQRTSVYLDSNELNLLKNSGEKNTPSNIRMVLISDKDTYYANTQAGTGVKPYIEHYNTLSIPMVNSSDAKEILKGETGKTFINAQIKKEFDPEAMDLIVSVTDKQDGYYPEKALSYMKKISAFYTDKDKITAQDVQEYEAQTSDIKKTDESQSEFRVVFDTGKKLDDIVGNPMTKAEAQSIVNQILMQKKGFTRGYTTFLDNGTSYGGGRRHTAEAIAGEANIPMIMIDAKEFALKDIEAFAQNANLSEIKIKKLINTAKTQAEANKNKTAMIFIENFDNFGSNPLYGISSIYEQKAFSQLLSEMEQVRRNENVNLVVVGSTNYPNYLDENIMKPYKFLDKIIIYSPQDVRDRSDILKYYIDKNNLKLAAQSEQEREELIQNVAETTNYFSVVDLIYLLEKADDISRERGKDAIDKSDFTEAYLQVTTGRVSSRKRAEHEDELVAKHECGHALTLQIMYDIAQKEEKPWHLPNQVNFITLDPRGSFGGAMFPKESKNEEYSFEKIFSELVCDFGGHASEKRFYNMDGSWGITQDMAMATHMAKLAVQKMGMGAKTGRISIERNNLGLSDVSEDLKKRMDSDMEALLKNAEIASNKIIEAYSDFVELFAQKYKDRVGTGDCIISSDEFSKMLEDWKKSLSEEKLKELDSLEDEILNIIAKAKKGEVTAD